MIENGLKPALMVVKSKFGSVILGPDIHHNVAGIQYFWVSSPNNIFLKIRSKSPDQKQKNRTCISELRSLL